MSEAPAVGTFWREKARPERIVEVLPFQPWQARDADRVVIKSRSVANARKQVFPSAVLLSTFRYRFEYVGVDITTSQLLALTLSASTPERSALMDIRSLDRTDKAIIIASLQVTALTAVIPEFATRAAELADLIEKGE